MVKEKIRNYVVSRFLYGACSDTLRDDQSLFDTGVLDSIAVLELVEFIENSFEVTVEDNELVRENFDSLDSMVRYLETKRVAA